MAADSRPNEDSGFKLKPSPIAILSQLFVSLFSTAKRIRTFSQAYQEIQSLVIELPSENVSPAEMASALAQRLQERGLVTEELMNELIRLRPFKAFEIRHAAEVWGINLSSAVRRPVLAKQFSLIGFPVTALFGIALYATLCEPAPLNMTSIDQPELKPGFAFIRPIQPNAEYEPVLLSVVSIRTGESWTAVVSKYRTCDSVAREIFFDIQSAPKARANFHTLLDAGEFRICQSRHCFTRELVHDVIDIKEPVHIEVMMREPVSHLSGPSISCWQDVTETGHDCDPQNAIHAVHQAMKKIFR